MAHRQLIMAAAAALVLASGALAQVARMTQTNVARGTSSGPVANVDGQPDVPVVVYSEDLIIPNAAVSRLIFSETILSGSIAAGTGSFITITSAQDGATQRLNAEHLVQWSGHSAYFNGPVLTVRLWAYPGTGENRLSVSGAIIESTSALQPRTLCDGADDRVPSSDNRQGRFGGGCTAWVINDMNSSLLTAGHCGASSTSVMSFNVPLSTSTGSTRAAHPDDQYVVDIASNQGVSGGVGNDWRYIGVFPNSNHGQTPVQRYGVRHNLAAAAPAAAGQSIRITGYGTNATPMPRELSQTQQTHAGPYFSMSGTTVRYRPDTTGGNSGSAVQDESTGLAIGIHTHGGCTSTGGSNAGTAIHHPDLQAAMANPLSICASGRGTVGGTWYALGDQANNFGTINPAPANFAKIAQIGAEWQGLAFNRTLNVFYAVNEARQLFTITPAGATTLLGTVTGPTNIITGLAFDPSGTGTLYAMQPSNGQLYRINVSTRVATTIGSALGGTVRALEFDSFRNVLWGIDQSGGAARLVRINTTTGTRTVIGSLGAGIVTCGDLACSAFDGSLQTIDSATEQLLSINPATGVATSLGTTGGIFGTAYGLASSALPDCLADFNNDNLVTTNDIFDYLNAWFSGLAAADVDGGAGLTTSDVFFFLNVWFAGCP